MNNHDATEPDLGLEQKMALRNAASRLQKQFDGVFNAETIERFLYSSYDEFASRSTVLTWLPLLAEKFARQRLQARRRRQRRQAIHRLRLRRRP